MLPEAALFLPASFSNFPQVILGLGSSPPPRHRLNQGGVVQPRKRGDKVHAFRIGAFLDTPMDAALLSGSLRIGKIFIKLHMVLKRTVAIGSIVLKLNMGGWTLAVFHNATAPNPLPKLWTTVRRQRGRMQKRQIKRAFPFLAKPHQGRNIHLISHAHIGILQQGKILEVLTAGVVL